MEKIWRKICTHYDIAENVVSDWYTRIVNQLSAPNSTRAYHNWHEMMLRKEEHLSEVNNLGIALAAFFQYYHYDGNRCCVQENIAVFDEFSRDAMIEDKEEKNFIRKLLGEKVADGEVHISYDDEANLLQDIDLAILAAPSEEYKHYTQLLRMEYANLNDACYRIMRLRVLETLLVIPQIFATPEFHAKYEEAARLNIKQDIDELKSM